MSIRFSSNPLTRHPSSSTKDLPKYQTLPRLGMSRANQILPYLPFSSSTLWAWSKDGRFPPPVKISPTMTAWRNSDVIDWLNQQDNSAGTVEVSDEQAN